MSILQREFYLILMVETREQRIKHYQTKVKSVLRHLIGQGNMPSKTPPERDLHTIKFVGPRGQPPPFPMIPSTLSRPDFIHIFFKKVTFSDLRLK